MFNLVLNLAPNGHIKKTKGSLSHGLFYLNLGSGITLHATCDNWMKIFFDGKLAFEDTHYGKLLSSRLWQWEVQTAIEIPDNTKTIGIECQNDGPGYRGIIASTSNGVVSNTLSWMCTLGKARITCTLLLSPILWGKWGSTMGQKVSL